MPKAYPFNIEMCEIIASKHFRNKYMRLWNWDYHILRRAIKEAYKIEKAGKTKFEAYFMEGGKSRKVIFVYYFESDSIFVISGSSGGDKI